MAFLTESDFRQVINDEDRSVIESTDEITKTQAEETAIEYFKGFLRNRYNIDAIFTAEGTERNPVIVMYLADTVVYNMHASVPNQVIPEMRQDRMEKVDWWLERVSWGKINPGLPLIDEETDPGNPIRFSSNEKISGSY